MNMYQERVRVWKETQEISKLIEKPKPSIKYNKELLKEISIKSNNECTHIYHLWAR